MRTYQKLLKRMLPSNFILFVRKTLNNIHRFKYIKFNSSIKIKTTKETLDKIKEIINSKTKGAYIRFGDSDIFILKGLQSGRHQKFDKNLSLELKESLCLNEGSIIKSVAIHSKRFGIEKNMKIGIHERPDWEAQKLMLNCFEYFIGSKIYSPVALHYQLVYNKEYAIDFLNLIRKFNPIFVGSSKNSKEIIKSLLDTDSFIQTPHTNSYSEIDNIEKKVLKELRERNKDYDFVVLSCGAMAKALIKRLYLNYNRPIFLFDMGSVIDVFHGRTKWTWVKESGINKEYLDLIMENLN